MINTQHLLTTHLEACVPLEMQALQQQGGATDWHFEEAQKRMQQFRESEASEALYFPVNTKGQTRHMIGVLVECLAVLAFVPGGISAFGCHFEAQQGVRCAWCGKSVDPVSTRPVAVHDDPNSEHVTGTEPVCSECLETPLGALEFEVCFV